MVGRGQATILQGRDRNRLEGGRTGKFHNLLRYGVHKGEEFRMEEHPVTIPAISVQAVTANRASEPQGMSGMNAELVSPARQRSEAYPGSPVCRLQLVPVGDPHLPVLWVVYLQRPVVGIEPEGQTDLSIVSSEGTLHYGLVPFDNGPLHELPVELPVGIAGNSDDKQAGGVHIEAVYGGLLNHLGDACAEPGCYAVLFIGSTTWNGEQAAGFVDDDYCIILEEYFEFAVNHGMPQRRNPRRGWHFSLQEW